MKNPDILLDSYAWIEYFLGTEKGRVVSHYLENNSCFTSLIIIAELSAKYASSSVSIWNERLEFIRAKTEILPLTLEISSLAGRTRQKMRETRPRFGLADAVIYETALAHELTVLSGDPHFKGLPNVIFLE